ncbi:MAG: DsbA family protein [bacterium]
MPALRRGPDDHRRPREGDARRRDRLLQAVPHRVPRARRSGRPGGPRRHRQGRFWPMHDLIFQNQGSLGPQKFIDFATELGLNVDRFKVDMESKEIREQVLKDRQEGVDAGISATPTLFINGRMYLEQDRRGPPGPHQDRPGRAHPR